MKDLLLGLCLVGVGYLAIEYWASKIVQSPEVEAMVKEIAEAISGNNDDEEDSEEINDFE